MEILNINGWETFYQRNSSKIVDIRFTVLAVAEKEESDRSFGTAHFVEHLIFKGTNKRSYLDISDEVAAIGGQINAFTSRSVVSYYIRIIKMNWESAFEILSDIFFNSVFDDKEIVKERNVILEEAKSNIDDHENFIMEEAVEHALSPNRGHRIIGSLESIASITRDDLLSFIAKNYRGKNVLISVCGDVERDEVVDTVSRYIPQAEKSEREFFSENAAFNFTPLSLERENLQQAYSILMYKGLGKKDPLYYAQKVLLNAVGGGMHSLLFKEIREEKGLCYSIGAWEMGVFDNFSAVAIGTNLSKNNLDMAKSLICQIVDDVKRKGIDSKLIDISKVDYTSSLAMSTETSSGYIVYYAINYLLGNYREFEEVYSLIHGVTGEEIIKVANIVFGENKDVLLS